MKSTRAVALGALLCFAVALVCSAGARASSPAPVTFNKDVAPIFYKNCIGCHRPGEIAPMSLITFKEVRPWAKAIREKVATRVMPPWHADQNYGKWENDRRLTQKEIDTVVAWIDGGAAEGKANDLPARAKARQRMADWRTRRCLLYAHRVHRARRRQRALSALQQCRRTSRKTGTFKRSKRVLEISQSCITS